MNVTVVIPCWNGASTLERAIRSAVSTECDVRVIVVDDKSSDNTVEVATEAGAEVIHFRHRRGQSYTRNTGIEAAEDGFIQFLDCDDWLEPDKIDAHARTLIADPELDLTWGPLRLMAPKWKGKTLDKIISQSEMHHIYPQLSSCPQTGSLLFRKDILWGRPWPEEVRTKYRGATPAFWKRILKRNPNLRYTPEGVAVYNVGNPNSISRSLPEYHSEDPEWPSP